MRISVKY
jgi:hypothetical protein